MRLFIISIIFCLIIGQSLAQIREGVYSTETIPCNNHPATMSFEIIKKSDDYYYCRMRVKETKNIKYINKYIIEYYGAYKNGQLVLNKIDTYKIEDEKLTSKKYYPGTRRRISYNNKFTGKVLRVIIEQPGQSIQFKGYLRCKNPTLNYNPELTKKFAEAQRVLGKSIQSHPVTFNARNDRLSNIFALYKWSKKYEKEIPEVDPLHSQLRYRKKENEFAVQNIRNLFTDDTFIPVFGKPFDELNVEERNDISTAYRYLTQQSPITTLKQRN